MNVVGLPSQPPGRDIVVSPRAARVVATVDHVLQGLPPRSRLTRQEATLAVAETMLVLGDSPAERTASEALDHAMTARDFGATIDRMVIVDALLDVRLAMTHLLASEGQSLDPTGDEGSTQWI